MVSLVVQWCPCKNEETKATTIVPMENEEAVVHTREDNIS